MEIGETPVRAVGLLCLHRQQTEHIPCKIKNPAVLLLGIKAIICMLKHLSLQQQFLSF